MNCSCNMPCEETAEPKESIYEQHELIKKLQKQNREYEARFNSLIDLKIHLGKRVFELLGRVSELDIENRLLRSEVDYLKKECHI